MAGFDPIYPPTGGSGPSPASTVTGPDAFGAAAVVGTSLLYARGDHDHGLPTAPSGTVPALPSSGASPLAAGLELRSQFPNTSGTIGTTAQPAWALPAPTFISITDFGGKADNGTTDNGAVINTIFSTYSSDSVHVVIPAPVTGVYECATAVALTSRDQGLVGDVGVQPATSKLPRLQYVGTGTPGSPATWVGAGPFINALGLTSGTPAGINGVWFRNIQIEVPSMSGFQGFLLAVGASASKANVDGLHMEAVTLWGGSSPDYYTLGLWSGGMLRTYCAHCWYSGLSHAWINRPPGNNAASATQYRPIFDNGGNYYCWNPGGAFLDKPSLEPLGGSSNNSSTAGLSSGEPGPGSLSVSSISGQVITLAANVPQDGPGHLDMTATLTVGLGTYATGSPGTFTVTSGQTWTSGQFTASISGKQIIIAGAIVGTVTTRSSSTSFTVTLLSGFTLNTTQSTPVPFVIGGLPQVVCLTDATHWENVVCLGFAGSTIALAAAPVTVTSPTAVLTSQFAISSQTTTGCSITTPTGSASMPGGGIQSSGPGFLIPGSNVAFSGGTGEGVVAINPLYQPGSLTIVYDTGHQPANTNHNTIQTVAVSNGLNLSGGDVGDSQANSGYFMGGGTRALVATLGGDAKIRDFSVNSIGVGPLVRLCAAGGNVVVEGNPVTLPAATSFVISAASWSGGVVTLTVTGGTSSFTSGRTILVSAISPSGYNGTFACTVSSSTQLTYPLPVNPGGATVTGAHVYQANGLVDIFGQQLSNVSVRANQLSSGSQVTVPIFDSTGVGPTGGLGTLDGTCWTEDSLGNIRRGFGGAEVSKLDAFGRPLLRQTLTTTTAFVSGNGNATGLTLTGNDQAGVVTYVCGTTTGASVVLNIVFANGYTSAPTNVLLIPLNTATNTYALSYASAAAKLAITLAGTNVSTAVMLFSYIVLA